MAIHRTTNTCRCRECRPAIAILKSDYANDSAWTANRRVGRLEDVVKDLAKRVKDLEAVVHAIRVRLK